MTALKAPCQHGRYEKHRIRDAEGFISPYHSVCPGGTLLPSDSLVIVKEDGEWPEWVRLPNAPFTVMGILDALAAAQPGSETELDRNQMGIW